VRETIYIRLTCAKKGTNAGKQEEKSQEVYISRVCGATPSGQIPTKLGIGKCVRLTDVIKRAEFHLYDLRGFEALRR